MQTNTENKNLNEETSEFSTANVKLTKKNIKIILAVVGKYIKPHFKTLILCVVLMFLVAFTTSGYAYLLKEALDKIFVSKNVKMLIIIPFFIAAVSFFKNAFLYLQSTLMSITFARVHLKLQKDMLSKLIYSDVHDFTEKSSAKMMSGILNEIGMVSGGMNTILTVCVRELLTVVFLFAFLFYENPMLTVLSMASFPFIIYPMILISKRLKNLTQGLRSGLEGLLANIDESLKSPKLIKSFNAEQFHLNKTGVVMDELLTMNKRMIRLSKIPPSLNEFIGIIGMALVIWYGGFQVIQDKATTGEFFSFFVAMTLVYRPLKALSGLNLTVQMFITGCLAFDKKMKKQPQVRDQDDSIELDTFKNSIEFQNVSFNYPKVSETVVSGVSFEVKKGEVVAIVGATGAGKSTITSLLMRFYDVTGGNINIDGYNIRDLTLKSLRDKMAYVSQDVHLIEGSVADNIRYTKLDATFEEVEHAAKMANASEFIHRLGKEYDTNIGHGGIRLSGGQRQRIAIARAILYDSPILLLDEATSALDSVSEKLIKDSLNLFMKNRTTIVIAHRLSTISHADKIIVMDHGKIVEVGTHKELSTRENGVYNKFYTTQFEREDAEESNNHEDTKQTK